MGLKRWKLHNKLLHSTGSEWQLFVLCKIDYPYYNILFYFVVCGYCWPDEEDIVVCTLHIIKTVLARYKDNNKQMCVHKKTVANQTIQSNNVYYKYTQINQIRTERISSKRRASHLHTAFIFLIISLHIYVYCTSRA